MILHKSVIPIFLSIGLGATYLNLPIKLKKSTDYKKPLVSTNETDSIRGKALVVLKKNCNICHQIFNPFKVFKETNMDKNAPLIYKQVFVLKRMPKGGGKLNESDRRDLLAYLETMPIERQKRSSDTN